MFEVKDLRKWYNVRSDGMFSNLIGEQRHLKAVDDVSFEIEEGEILGVAGQSGCGKSTLGELLVRLQEPTKGKILFWGEDISEHSKKEMKKFRQQCQIIFQDPYESLNPRFSVAKTVREPLEINNIGDREERDNRTLLALEDAGLNPPEKYLQQLPAELSGGERQRVCVARALVMDPSFIVADEPVSMLDVSVRTGILHLFEKLQNERDLTVMYISHDLSTINYLSDRAMVMFLGNIIEIGPTADVIQNPAHPYTDALIESVPSSDPSAPSLSDQGTAGQLTGDIPNPVDMVEGCRFRPWCEYSQEDCKESEPALIYRGENPPNPNSRRVACFHALENSDNSK